MTPFGSAVRRRDVLRAPAVRPARREDLLHFGAAVALRFFADRPVCDVGERVAVFGGEDQAAFAGQRFDGAPCLSGGETISQARSSASANGRRLLAGS